MATTTYYQPMEYLTTRQPGLSYIRALHASPGAPGVDIYLNQNLVTKNLTYTNFTPYLGISPGMYSVKVYPAGMTNNPVINTNIDIRPNSIYTAAAIGRLNDIELYPIPDPVISPVPNKTRIRFVHLSPNAPAVDITLANGSVLFSDVMYKEYTTYISLPPGRYTLQARATGTENILLNVPNVVLRPSRNLSIYAVGLIGETPPLQVLIPLDGSSYLPI